MAESISCTVLVENIAYACSVPEIERELKSIAAGLQILSISAMKGKAKVELPSLSIADTFMQRVRGHRLQNRALRAELIPTSASSHTYVQADLPKRWQWRDSTAEPQEKQEEKNHADMAKIFDQLPDGLVKKTLFEFVHSRTADGEYVLKEIYLAIGRQCELVFAHKFGGPDIRRSNNETLEDHLENFLTLFEGLPSEVRRTGIDDTLHRISRTVHATARRVVAITARVGRTLQGGVLPMLCDSSDSNYQINESEPGERLEPDVSPALADLVSKGLLLIGPPNTGKTTVLRELARLLSLGRRRVVVIVDKSMEIAGTGIKPHAAIGHARVLTCHTPSEQHRVMLEAVENQSPDVVIVDELSTKEECAAARTITGRGVAVVASVHGDSLAQIASDPERSLLVGGIGSVTLSAREAEARADGLRQVSKRLQPSVFGAAVELRGFTDWILHADLETAIDRYLDYQPFRASWRTKERGLGADTVLATPVVGCRQQGSAVGFAYARLRVGEKLAQGQPIDFTAVNPSGQSVWTRVNEQGSPPIYERTPATMPSPRSGSASAPTRVELTPNRAPSPPYDFGGLSSRGGVGRASFS